MSTSNVNSVFQIAGSLQNTSGIPGAVLPISDYAKIKTIAHSDVGSVANNQYKAFWSLSSPTTTGIYQVPAGKTFICIQLSLTGNAALSGDFIFGYATAVFVNQTTTPPTGAVYYTGGATPATDGGVHFSVPAGPAFLTYAINISFPALSYPFWTMGTGAGNSWMTMIGVEV